jgi:hypothetical protein
MIVCCNLPVVLFLVGGCNANNETTQNIGHDTRRKTEKQTIQHCVVLTFRLSDFAVAL